MTEDTPKSLFAQNEEGVVAHEVERDVNQHEGTATNLEGEVVDAADPTPSVESVAAMNNAAYNEQYSQTGAQNINDPELTLNAQAELGEGDAAAQSEAQGEIEINLPDMNYSNLEKVRDAVARKMQEQRQTERDANLNTIKVLMGKHGFKSSEVKVAKQAGTRKSSGKVAPKYRNPANPDQTWTGRGIAPAWIRDHEDRSQFLIEAPTA